MSSFNSYGQFDPSAWQWGEGTGLASQDPAPQGGSGQGAQTAQAFASMLGQAADGVFSFMGARQHAKAAEAQAEAARAQAQQQQSAFMAYMGQQGQQAQEATGMNPQTLALIGGVAVLALAIGGGAIFVFSQRKQPRRKA